MADDEGVDYVTVDVVEGEVIDDDAESDYGVVNAVHGREYDDGKSRVSVDVFVLTADDVANDVVGDEIVALVARGVAVSDIGMCYVIRSCHKESDVLD